MKILVPVSNTEYIDKFIDAGADEFYLGFHDDNWIDKFGKYADINRMSGFAERANPFTFEQLTKVTEDLKNKDKGVFVAINANEYSAEQIRYMTEHYFCRLKEVGVDGVIMSDADAICAAEKAGLNPVASTMCAIYNEDIARIYRDMGVNRMILPRDLSLKEIEQICSAMPEIHFEAFFMRNGCIFSDCYCLGMHRPECGATCTYTRYGKSTYTHMYKSFADHNAVDVNDYLYRTAFHIDACAMCALYRLNAIGIQSLKIVGRADDWDSVCRDIELTKKNIEIMEKADSEDDYLNNMIFTDNFPSKCREGISCYYPEVRFKETEQ